MSLETQGDLLAWSNGNAEHLECVSSRIGPRFDQASETDVVRFLEKAKGRNEKGCWLWSAKTNRFGYSAFWFQRHEVRGHRFAIMALGGRFPPSTQHQVDHLCRTRNCVNPEHLEWVTARENVVRGTSVVAQNAMATACVRGHPLTGLNLKWSRAGKRKCATCEVLRAAQRRERRRRGEVSSDMRARSGEQNGWAKLDWVAVREIRRLAGSGVFQRVIAERFGVTQTCVSLIVRGVNWPPELDRGHVKYKVISRRESLYEVQP